MEFCYTFDGILTNEDSQSGSMLRYVMDNANEKSILFIFDNIHVDSHINLEFVDHQFLNVNDPTALRITIINASKLGKAIVLRTLRLPWLIDPANGESNYYCMLSAGESVTLQTAFNTQTGMKAWTKDVSLSLFQEYD